MNSKGNSYISAVAVRRLGGPDKSVNLPGMNDEVVMGSHREIAPHIGSDPELAPHPATLDYVVGAVAGCLAGTFARTLASRGIDLPVEHHRVEGRGELDTENQVLVIKRIVVDHHVTLPERHHAEAQRLHGVYKDACPTSRSVRDAIEIESLLHLN